MRASGGLLVGPCDAGPAAGAQSDVETYMPRPHQEAGAGAPSYIGRGDMQKYVQGARLARQAGGAGRAFLSVLWLVLLFWDGNRVKKTQEPGPKRPKNPG